MKTRHTMQDHSATDPRSVAAQLRGTGDGRGEKYLRFEKKMMESQPSMTIAAIAAAYSAWVRDKATIPMDRRFAV